MDQIVVGVDTSDTSRRAVQFAVARAKEYEAGLVVVHVIPWSPFSFNTPSENEHRHQRKEAELAAAREQVTDPIVAAIKDSGVPVEVVLRHGHPAETLGELAEQHKAVHIVVGRTGDSAMRERFFGSTASRLVHFSPVPVTVVP